MWPSTRLTTLLGVRHPIIQAPMVGSTTAELAAAVSNAGGLGSIGCATLSGDDLRGLVADLRQRTNQAFNLNFFAHRAPQHNEAVLARARERLAPYYAALGLGEPPRTTEAAFPSFGPEQAEALVALQPPVVSFHFGMPDAELVRPLKRYGAVILSSATSVAEARALEAAGADAIIAQGWEAGGHRGAFEAEGEDVGVGTLSLVPQIADAVAVPVIAAGGIADGRGIAAALALGADGVQLGTAFLSCPEASVADMHRAALKTARDTDTRLTRAVSGRPARARANRYIREMAKSGEKLPDFPLMYGLSAPLLSSGNEDFQFLLYGQSAALNREMPAGELVEKLVAETEASLGRLRAGA